MHSISHKTQGCICIGKMVSFPSRARHCKYSTMDWELRNRGKTPPGNIAESLHRGISPRPLKTRGYASQVDVAVWIFIAKPVFHPPSSFPLTFQAPPRSTRIYPRTLAVREATTRFDYRKLRVSTHVSSRRLDPSRRRIKRESFSALDLSYPEKRFYTK